MQSCQAFPETIALYQLGCCCLAEFYASQIFRQGVRCTIEPDNSII